MIRGGHCVVLSAEVRAVRRVCKSKIDMLDSASRSQCSDFRNKNKR